MRQNFNVGQEIVSEDLNYIQSRADKGLFDRVLYELMGRKTDAFFGDSFKPLYQSSTSILVKAGLGFMSATSDGKEPSKKPVTRATDVTLNIDTPDSSNGRIDILVVKWDIKDVDTESRKYKDEFTDTISTQDFIVSKDWDALVEIVTGTPAGSPIAPATPTGYLKIAEIAVSASTGIANQAAITDLRSLLPKAVALGDTGSSEYDAIVGTVGTDQGANYGDLKSALDNASDGWKILVLRDQTINTVPIVTKNKIEIVFKRGVTFTKGSANRGLQVNGNDCKIVNGRFSGFSVGGNSGLYINSGALRTVLNQPRFFNCATNISDNGTDTYTDVVYQE